jgi:ketosteroid isomerase-like protein
VNAAKSHAHAADAIRAMFAATDRGDLDAVTSYFNDDVVAVLSNREPIHGAAAYLALYVLQCPSLRRRSHIRLPGLHGYDTGVRVSVVTPESLG